MKINLDRYVCRDNGRNLPTTLGSDPEFLLFSKDKEAPDEEGKKKFQRFPTERLVENSHRAAIGADHCGRVGEFRPRPANSPKEAVEHLRTLILRLGKQIKECHYSERYEIFAVVGGARDFEDAESIGGHIHVGWPDQNKIPTETALRQTAINLLDYFVGRPLKAAIGGERAGSQHGSYGRDGDFRMQDRYGFEYRTPPSFIKHPLIVLAVFDTVESIFKYIVSNTGVVEFPYERPTYMDYKTLGATGDTAFIMTHLYDLKLDGGIVFPAWENANVLTLGDFFIEQAIERDGHAPEEYYKFLTVFDKTSQPRRRRAVRTPPEVTLESIHFVEEMNRDFPYSRDCLPQDMSSVKDAFQAIINKAVGQGRLPDKQYRIKLHFIDSQHFYHSGTYNYYLYARFLEDLFGYTGLNNGTNRRTNVGPDIMNPVPSYQLRNVTIPPDVFTEEVNTFNVVLGLQYRHRSRNDILEFLTNNLTQLYRVHFRRRR